MFQGIMVIAGPARCGKTARLLEAYRTVLAARPAATEPAGLSAGLWLSPNARTAGRVRQQLVDQGLAGCFSPNSQSFDQLARRILDASSRRVRPIGPVETRQILRQLVERAVAENRLSHFGPIAATRGFLDLLVRFIEELKRLEVWPKEFIEASGPRPSAKDRELGQLYEAYQELLNQHDLYDAAGCFWTARELLRSGTPRPVAGVRHVVVDGFTDFTRTELEILEILSPRVESLTISLPLESDPGREDLFAKPAQTLDSLRRRMPNLTVEWMPRREPVTKPVNAQTSAKTVRTVRGCTSLPPSLAHVERHLFGNPRQLVPSPDTQGIEILAAGGLTHEIELVAGRIKQLLTAGDTNASTQTADGDDAARTRVRPGDILVIFRSLTDSAELVRQVFHEFGIPHALPVRTPLASTGVMAALTGWLRMDRDDWPFRQVLAVLLHNYFRPPWKEAQQGRAILAAERMVHALQVPAGRDDLLNAIRRFAETSSSDEHRTTAQLALGLFERVSRALDDLPRKAKPAEWAAALEAFAHETGLWAAKDESPVPRARDETLTAEELDRLAVEQLLRALRAGERLSAWVGQAPRSYTRDEFFEYLEEVLREEVLERSVDETGRVRIVSAEAARNLSAPYVFLAGLSERSFPAAQREDCIHSEAETRALIEAGLPLVPLALRNRFEMLLFYEAVTRATRRLVLSYPALDPAVQPLSPSPYLADLERACGAGRIAVTGQPELSAVPTSDRVLSPRQLRVRAISQAMTGETRLLAALGHHPATAKATSNLRAGLLMSSARYGGETFGPFEGMLTSAAAQRTLRARYGPEHCWSPSQLEQYARCPFQFYLERVLRLESLDEPTFEIDYRGRGQLLHRLLSLFHRRRSAGAAGAGSATFQSDEAWRAEFAAILSELLGSAANARPFDEGMLEIDSRRVAAMLADYRRQHAEYETRSSSWAEPMRPAHFEVAFGPGARGPRSGAGKSRADHESDDVDPLSSESPFELVCGEETILFSGRIDRIDLGRVDGQVVFNIVDYKSGKSSSANAKAVTGGLALQLPLYALAAQQMLAEREALAYAAAYWHVKGKGCQQAVQFRTTADGELALAAEWPEFEAMLRVRVRSLVAGIRQGEFPMQSVDEDCTSRCQFSTVCRVNQARSLGKQWAAPTFTPSGSQP